MGLRSMDPYDKPPYVNLRHTAVEWSVPTTRSADWQYLNSSIQLAASQPLSWATLSTALTLMKPVVATIHQVT